MNVLVLFMMVAILPNLITAAPTADKDLKNEKYISRDLLVQTLTDLKVHKEVIEHAIADLPEKVETPHSLTEVNAAARSLGATDKEIAAIDAIMETKYDLH